MRSLLLLSATALVVPVAALAQDARSDPAAPAPVHARARATAYIELDQAVVADLNRDDTVAYAQVAAGLDASIATARAQGQVSYRYERRIAEQGRYGDNDIQTGLARLSYRVARPLTLEAGAIATRTRIDVRGAAPAITDTADASNVTQLYSLYAGPTLSTHAGPVELGASYRFGYTRVEAPGVAGLAPGSPRLDYLSDSTGHEATVSAGIAPRRVLPFGVTLSGGYARETAGQLSQRYEDYFGRGDVLMPLTGTLAVTAGVGYQHVEISQKDAALDAAGTPLTDRNGRFVTDQASPRRIAYDTDGLIYDAGVVWRPSPRTSLTATVAHQYDSTSYTGEFDWKIDRSLTFRAAAYDGIETFGHQLRHGLQGLPTSFVVQRDSFGQQFNGCVYGDGAGAGGAGGCLNDVFQSITTAGYRARGVDAVLSASRGYNRFGVGAGYSNRRLFSPRTAPGLSLYGLDNDSYYVQGLYSRRIDRRSTFDASVFANWYDSAVPGANGSSGDVFGTGATGAYTRSFGRLGATAQLGLYYFDQQHYLDQLSAQALVGARYQF
nr:hypothetical protein [Sphingomonas bacterium]